MAITLNNLGTFQTTAGATDSSVSATSISGTNGNLMVLLAFYNIRNNTGGSVTPAPTMGGSWSGTWTRRAYCEHGLILNGQYGEGVEIWTSPISGSPSGTITYDLAYTTNDSWLGFVLLEVSGQHASPIGLSASPSQQSSTSTFNTDLGATPASDSLVVGVVHDNNQTGPAVVQPSGWTEVDEQSPAWGAISEWAYKNGSSVQSPQWSGFTNASNVRMYGCALEILAASAAANTAINLMRTQQIGFGAR